MYYQILANIFDWQNDLNVRLIVTKQILSLKDEINILMEEWEKNRIERIIDLFRYKSEMVYPSLFCALSCSLDTSIIGAFLFEFFLSAFVNFPFLSVCMDFCKRVIIIRYWIHNFAVGLFYLVFSWFSMLNANWNPRIWSYCVFFFNFRKRRDSRTRAGVFVLRYMRTAFC